MDNYFTDEKIEELVTKYNWELVPASGGMYRLRQKDMNHMTSLDFMASEEAVRKFCARSSEPNPTEGK